MLQTRTGDEPYILHTNTSIKPSSWSAFATDEKNMKFICVHKSNNIAGYEVVNCKNNLKLCEFKYARFGTNHRGNYWLVKNKSMRGAFRGARWHGILLIDPKRKKLAGEEL